MNLNKYILHLLDRNKTKNKLHLKTRKIIDNHICKTIDKNRNNYSNYGLLAMSAIIINFFISIVGYEKTLPYISKANIHKYSSTEYIHGDKVIRHYTLWFRENNSNFKFRMITNFDINTEQYDNTVDYEVEFSEVNNSANNVYKVYRNKVDKYVHNGDIIELNVHNYLIHALKELIKSVSYEIDNGLKEMLQNGKQN